MTSRIETCCDDDEAGPGERITGGDDEVIGCGAGGCGVPVVGWMLRRNIGFLRVFYYGKQI